MGTFIAALKSTEGILSTKMMKLLLLTCLAAVALAEPYYGYPYYHQLQWPSVRAPGFSATCWGCRGKRSADAEPEAEADAYYGYPYYGYGYGYRTPGYGYTHVHRFGKRSAEPEPYYGYPFYGYYGYGYGRGVAGHPTGVSYTQRSPQGIGKRSAEEPKEEAAAPAGSSFEYALPGTKSFAKLEASYLFPHYQGNLGKRSADEEPATEEAAPAMAYGIHPKGGKSFVGQTVWGFPRSKRSAEPGYYYGYPGYGYHGYGGRSYVGRTIWGLGK